MSHSEVPPSDEPASDEPASDVPCRLSDLVALAGERAQLSPALSTRDQAVGDGADPVIGDVTHDSRRAGPGALYAALPGGSVHGAEFAGDAARGGAVAILTDPAGAGRAEAAGVPVLIVDDPRAVLGTFASRVHGDPTAALQVIGVTGTNGKTTTAYLIEAGLRAAGVRTGLIGTVETRIADAAVPSVRTTPEATDLQALFARMRAEGVQSVVMEVSSHALSLGRVNGVHFAAALFTNLSQDHLDFHGDMEHYFAAKALLFDGRAQTEVINVDDPSGLRLLRPGSVTVSAAGASAAGHAAQWRATEIRPDGLGGTLFRAHGPDGLDEVASVRGPGSFAVANALLALATLVRLGTDPLAAIEGIGSAEVPGRMQSVRRGQLFLAFVDYCHTPEAIASALAALRPGAEGRLICVLGAGGDRDRSKRPLMGAAAATGADLVWVTDDNPRSEDPAAIRAAVLAGARSVGGSGIREVADRAEAIAEAVAAAGPGDTVLLAGKGHETTQDIGGVLRTFDDRDVLAAALDRIGATR